jgi:glucan endo-1,3-alpha-glucosidase
VEIDKHFIPIGNSDGPCRTSSGGIGKEGEDNDFVLAMGVTNSVECAMACFEDADCVAYEAQLGGSRCEKWKNIPDHTISNQGFECKRKPNLLPSLCCGWEHIGLRPPHFASKRLVFGHFVVGFTPTARNRVAFYRKQIDEAAKHGIDGFVLNVAAGASSKVEEFFNAVEVSSYQRSFVLFVSLDGNNVNSGSFDISVFNEFSRFTGHPNYFKVDNGRPVFSTFVGQPSCSGDSCDSVWQTWKSQPAWSATSCWAGNEPYFIPYWAVPTNSFFERYGSAGGTRIGANVADGAFHWSAWPREDSHVIRVDVSAVDEHFLSDLSLCDAEDSSASAPCPYEFMAPISPWFYKDVKAFGSRRRDRKMELFGHSENPLEEQFVKRWQHLVTSSQKPDYVQIVTWNDVSETHYIGPIDTGDDLVDGYENYHHLAYKHLPTYTYKMLHSTPESLGQPDMDHTAFLKMSAHYISLYKDEAPKSLDQFFWWYRLHPKDAVDEKNSTGHDQRPHHINGVSDEIVLHSIVTSGKTYEVTIGRSRFEHVPGDVGACRSTEGDDFTRESLSPADCEAKCNADVTCVAYEASQSGNRCELWRSSITHTAPSSTYICKRKIVLEEYPDQQGACRQTGAANGGSGDASDFTLEALSASECEERCALKPDCVAFEASVSGSHCEIWTSAVTHVAPTNAYICKRKLQRTYTHTRTLSGSKPIGQYSQHPFELLPYLDGIAHVTVSIREGDGNTYHIGSCNDAEALRANLDSVEHGGTCNLDVKTSGINNYNVFTNYVLLPSPM